MVPDFLTIAEAGALIAKRDLSPVELTQSRLARIERLDGQLHSFIRVLGDQALAAAREAEAEIMAGRWRGPLHGIPIGLKDIYETKRVPTTGHSKVMIDHVPQADATSVRRLTEAGAIMLGKLATHEFAFGGPSFDLPWPPARNPWDTTRFTGGSSSGTGAAVAAGLVQDCAILLQAMAGHDPADPASADRPVPDYRASLAREAKGLRIGLIRHFYETDNQANEATRQGIASAVKVFEDLGCSVRELRVSPLADWAACGIVIMLSEAYAIHEVTLRERFVDYGEAFRDRMALAALITGADYVQAMRLRRELMTELAKAMTDLDLVITAAAPSEAPTFDAVSKFAIFERPSLTMPFNVTGSPAMSVCCGYTEAGLPLAFQLVGKPFDEPTVLKAAHAYEHATSWRAIRPRAPLP